MNREADWLQSRCLAAEAVDRARAVTGNSLADLSTSHATESEQDIETEQAQMDGYRRTLHDDADFDFNSILRVLLFLALVFYLTSAYSKKPQPKTRIENGRIIKL